MAVNYTTTLSNNIRDVYSKEILYQALPVMRFNEFVEEKKELGVEPGLTVKFIKYSELTNGGKIAETSTITGGTLSTNLVSITVSEYAGAITVSEKLLRSAFDDVMASVSSLLGRRYAKVIDGEIRDTFINGAGNTITGTTFNTTIVKDAVEILASNDTPKFDGENYICFVHPKQAREIRDDSNWVSAVQYGDYERIYKGEIGRYESVKFIETTQIPKDGSYYKAVMFGKYSVGRAIALPVEMRDNGIEDYGRKRSLAFYSIEGFGVLESKYIVEIKTTS